MNDFIYLSRYSGMREDLVQAGGGNSSVKLSPSHMLIKASGFQLAELNENIGWCETNPQIIVDFFSNDKNEITKESEKQLLTDSVLSTTVNNDDGSKQLRPSIEIFLHSITQKYTLHTHPTVVNILTATNKGWQTLKELFPEALFVDYATPGIKLAAAYFKTFKTFGKIPDVIFLKNHGLVVSGKCGDFVKNTTEEVLAKIEKHLHLDMSRYHNSTIIYDVARTVPVLKEKIVYLSQHHDILKALDEFGERLWNYQFCPDCLVYCGKHVLSLDDDFSASDFLNHLSKYGNPVILTFRNNVYILADSVKKAKEIESVFAFSAQVALANKDTQINLLSDNEQNFLLNWDAEKYRQSMK
ncbi:MAG: class II aldolase/adducin family protein [Spirochaetaceae bacterium]|nr:class II aldolase/adducin family protein [Spirochaetaceae bacterium]